jgi:hypothetical protein
MTKPIFVLENVFINGSLHHNRMEKEEHQKQKCKYTENQTLTATLVHKDRLKHNAHFTYIPNIQISLTK